MNHQIERIENDGSLVSVVVTTYHRKTEYVREAIESALCQTHQNIEIIVVDDNGEESPYSFEIAKMCESYAGVIYIRNKTNSGAQFSRNIGILSAAGEYVAFLDDDDIWVPEKTEIQLSFFNNPAVGMVYCDGYSFFDDDKDKLGVFREASLFDRPISHELELFNDYIGSTSQAMIRRDCFAAVGLFDCDMPARQDYEFWLRISKRYKIVGTPEKLLYYRKHSGERISTNWSKCHESYKLILSKYRSDYDSNKYAKAKLVLRIASSAYKAGKVLASVGFSLSAFLISPRCVVDVLRRKVTHATFSDFYSAERLKKVLDIR